MTQLDRRTLLRAFAYGLGSLTLGRAIAACSSPSSDSSTDEATGKDGDPDAGGATAPTPTDQDEHVPGASAPVDNGTDVPKVPVRSWESRAKQLEAEQSRLFGRTAFSRKDPGALAGKENSHEPRASVVEENGAHRVEVVVQHVMGANGLPVADAGAAKAGFGFPGFPGFPANPGSGTKKKDAGTVDAAPADAGPPAPAQVHYITTIYLRGKVNGTESVVGLWELASTDAAPPTIRFSLPAGVTEVVAYEWCTLHGLWMSPPLPVPPG